MAIKFMYNGIKADGKLYKAWYSAGPYTEKSGLPFGTITVYAKTYESFPQIDGLTVHNNTDTTTDYFEKDRIRITPNNPYYTAAKAAYDKAQARRTA